VLPSKTLPTCRIRDQYVPPSDVMKTEGAPKSSTMSSCASRGWTTASTIFKPQLSLPSCFFPSIPPHCFVYQNPIYQSSCVCASWFRQKRSRRSHVFKTLLDVDMFPIDLFQISTLLFVCCRARSDKTPLTWSIFRFFWLPILLLPHIHARLMIIKHETILVHVLGPRF